MRWWCVVGWLVAGCGGDPALGSGGLASTSSASTTRTGTGMTSTGAYSTSTAGAGTSGTSSTDDPSSGFVPPPDGESPFECSVFEQDCPRGQKCAAWADDAQGWNATKCVPVDPDPAAVGDACTTQGSSTSGIDDCELGALCWYPDGELQGECFGYCQGTPRAPICPQAHQCVADAAVCLPHCDPLGDDCGPGVCILSGGYWRCLPDASRPGATHGTPCPVVNGCPTGMLCIDASFHSSCAGASCCSTICALAAADDCASLDPAQSCRPFYRRGLAPQGYENVGVCAVPQ